MIRKRRDNDEEEDDLNKEPEDYHHRELKRNRPNIIDDDDLSDNDEEKEDDDVSDKDEEDGVSDKDEEEDDVSDKEEWFDSDDEIIMAPLPTRDDQSDSDGDLEDLALQFHDGICEHIELVNQEYADDPPPVLYAGDNEENWALPGIIVAVHRLGKDTSPIGVVRRVLQNGSCEVDVGSNENEELLTALINEIKIVPPKVFDKVTIIRGKRRGAIGELFDICGSDGMVELDDNYRIMKLDMSILAKIEHTPAPYAGDNEENWAFPDIIVAVHRLGEDTSPIGVVRRVYPDGSCKVDVGSNENEELLTALPNEIKIVPPQVLDKVKIIHGKRRGAIGELLDIRGSDGMVALGDTNRIMKLDMSILAKLGNV